MAASPLQGGKRVFVSFEYKHDHGNARHLIARARQRGYPAPVFDLSLREQYKVSTGEWVNKARAAISRCQLVIVIVGPNTHNAPGVAKEIGLAKKIGKQIIQVRPRGPERDPHPKLKDKPVILWTMKNLDKYLDSNYHREQ